MISIIIPLYNKEKAIEQCIQSVIQQTYTDWELIIVDDGSTDSSASKVKPFLKDQRIHYVYQKNRGVSSARNKGIDLAQGEWSIYIDADDYFLPNALSTLLHTAIKYGLNISSANFFVEKKKVKEKVCNGKERVIKDNFRALYFQTYAPRAGNTLFKTFILKQHKFKETLMRYEDAESIFNIIRTNKVAYTSVCVMTYSLNNISLSKPVSDISKDFIFSIDFTNKSFWERIILAQLINQGFRIYPKEKNFLYNKYASFMPLIYFEHILAYVPRIFHKLRKVFCPQWRRIN